MSYKKAAIKSLPKGLQTLHTSFVSKAATSAAFTPSQFNSTVRDALELELDLPDEVSNAYSSTVLNQVTLSQLPPEELVGVLATCSFFTESAAANSKLSLVAQQLQQRVTYCKPLQLVSALDKFIDPSAIGGGFSSTAAPDLVDIGQAAIPMMKAKLAEIPSLKPVVLRRLLRVLSHCEVQDRDLLRLVEQLMYVDDLHLLKAGERRTYTPNDTLVISLALTRIPQMMPRARSVEYLLDAWKFWEKHMPLCEIPQPPQEPRRKIKTLGQPPMQKKEREAKGGESSEAMKAEEETPIDIGKLPRTPSPFLLKQAIISIATTWTPYELGKPSAKNRRTMLVAELLNRLTLSLAPALCPPMAPKPTVTVLLKKGGGQVSAAPADVPTTEAPAAEPREKDVKKENPPAKKEKFLSPSDVVSLLDALRINGFTPLPPKSINMVAFAQDPRRLPGSGKNDFTAAICRWVARHGQDLSIQQLQKVIRAMESFGTRDYRLWSSLGKLVVMRKSSLDSVSFLQLSMAVLNMEPTVEPLWTEVGPKLETAIPGFVAREIEVWTRALMRSINPRFRDANGSIVPRAPCPNAEKIVKMLHHRAVDLEEQLVQQEDIAREKNNGTLPPMLVFGRKDLGAALRSIETCRVDLRLVTSHASDDGEDVFLTEQERWRIADRQSTRRL